MVIKKESLIGYECMNCGSTQSDNGWGGECDYCGCYELTELYF